MITSLKMILNSVTIFHIMIITILVLVVLIFKSNMLEGVVGEDDTGIRLLAMSRGRGKWRDLCGQFVEATYNKEYRRRGYASWNKCSDAWNKGHCHRYAAKLLRGVNNNKKWGKCPTIWDLCPKDCDNGLKTSLNYLGLTISDAGHLTYTSASKGMGRIRDKNEGYNYYK